MYIISQMIFPEFDTEGIHLFGYLTDEAQQGIQCHKRTKWNNCQECAAISL